MGTIYSYFAVFNSDYGMRNLRLCHYKYFDLVFDCFTFFDYRVAWICAFFRAKNKVIKKTLIVISIIALPFLAGLSAILKLPLILSMGSSIAVLSIAAVWGIYGVFVKYQKRVFLAFALSLLIVIPLACGITHIAAYFVESISMDFVSDLFHIITTLVLSGTCLMIDLVRQHRNNLRKGQAEL